MEGRTVVSKSGKTYKYYYRESKRGYTLVGKGGKITSNSKKNVREFEEYIRNNPDYSEAEKTTLINDLRAQIFQKKNAGKKLTTTGFLGKQEKDKIKRMLANAGYTAEELAKEISTEAKPITEDDILDAANWKDSEFGNETLGYWAIEFNYTGSILKRK